MTKRRNNQPTVQQKSKAEKQVVNHTAVATQSIFTGPLPPPEALEHYDKIAPGAADRIIAMAERESAHRHAIESKEAEINAQAMDKTFDERRCGQRFAFIIALLAIGGAIYCGFIGAYWVGIVIGGTAATCIVGAFLNAKK